MWNQELSQWTDIQPVEDAVVINTGNMMMRFTNDKYLSNLHRVINKTGKERYSVVYFFDGNPDYLVKCIPSCAGSDEAAAKYSPVTVEDWLKGRYADTYETEEGKAIGELLEGKMIQGAV